MSPVDVLVEMVEFNDKWMRQVVHDMAPEIRRWRPDPGANSINMTFWHLSRMLDVFKTRFFEGKSQEEELWFAQKYDAQTGYDSRGIGAAGMGSLSGYTPEEVNAIPDMDDDLLLAYYDAVHEAFLAYLRATPPEGLTQTVVAFGSENTLYNYARHVYLDTVRHFGEILAFEAMYKRVMGDR